MTDNKAGKNPTHIKCYFTQQQMKEGLWKD